MWLASYGLRLRFVSPLELKKQGAPGVTWMHTPRGFLETAARVIRFFSPSPAVEVLAQEITTGPPRTNTREM